MQRPRAMETDKNKNQTAGGQTQNSHKAPSRSQTPMVLMNSLEQKVQCAILGLHEASKLKTNIQLRQPTENIGVQLLEQFDEESDGEDNCLKVPTQSLPLHVTSNKNWGPVVAPRLSARIRRDGRTAIQKAEDLKKLKDLEVPKGNKNRNCNSFSAFNNDALMLKAKQAGLNLGNDEATVSYNIHAIRLVEDSRLSNFQDSHPECFLPANIDLNVDEFISSQGEKKTDQEFAHSSDYPDDVPTWSEVVSGRKSSCRKLNFNNGSRPMLEC